MRFCDGCGTPQALHPMEILLKAPNLASRHPDIAVIAAIFLATALTIFPLFTVEFTNNWGSIEAAYISDSAFISNIFPNVSWFPFWYGGLPFHLSYLPIFIYSVAAMHVIFGLTVAHSYHLLSAIAYSATPAALYLLAKFLTKSRLASIFAGLTYSFVPTFLPDPAPSHIGAVTVFGEGPHIFGWALGILAVLQLLRCMRKPTWYGCMLASVLIASVALTNLVALYGLAFLAVVAAATELIYRNNRGGLAFLFSGLVAYGLMAFQFDWDFIRTNSQVSAETAGGIRYSLILFPVLILAVLFLRKFVSRYLMRRTNTKPIFFMSLWVILLGVIVIGRTWFNTPQLAPQPLRYVPEFDAGLSLLIGFVIMKVAEAIPSLRRIGVRNFRMVRVGWLSCMLLLLLLVGVFFLMPLSMKETTPSISLAKVPEYQIATWLSGHVKDESVFATGTIAFWVNVFSNVRQIRGGSDQGATNTWWAAVTYQIVTGSDPSVSILWAQAWNVKYIVVDFPNSTTTYHDYIHPDKFRGILPLAYYFEGVGIYQVPLVRPGLVQSISAGQALSLTPISDVLDTRDLSAYVQLSQTSSRGEVSYTIINPDMISISVTNANDTAILVKTTFDPNWHADLQGRAIAITRIGPDFMVIYPNMIGNYQIRLHYDRSDGESIGLFLTIATLILVALIVSTQLYRHRRRKITPQSSANEPRC